jgi:hypothetical protein
MPGGFALADLDAEALYELLRIPRDCAVYAGLLYDRQQSLADIPPGLQKRGAIASLALAA